jgi:hypothetical protein
LWISGVTIIGPAPYGPFIYTTTDHNGFQDDGIKLVNANAQSPNGGYPPLKLG